MLEHTMVGILQVVEHVDPADERDPPVDTGLLAVQAAQPLAIERQPAAHRRIDRALHARPLQPLRDLLRQLACAVAVDHQPHRDAALGRPRKRARDLQPGLVAGEDVGLEPDLGCGGVDRGHQRREELRARLQQPQLVAVEQARPDPVDEARCAGVGRHRAGRPLSAAAAGRRPAGRGPTAGPRPGRAGHSRRRARSRGCRCGPSAAMAPAPGRCAPSPSPR